MAVGKNKKLGKKGKGGKKKTADLFTKKEWYEVRAPAVNGFNVRSIGRTCVTRTSGTKIARDSLMGRVFEVSLGDLKKESEEEAFRKFHLKVEDVSGMNCLTNFHGMDITTDKLRSMVRKWQSLVEAQADVRTTDGFTLRLFAIGFTKKQLNQTSKSCYAQHAQIRAIRKKMTEIIIKEASSVDLNGLVEKLQTENIGTEIEKHCAAIFPLKEVKIRRVKTLKSPKVDSNKLIEAHGGVEELAKTIVDMGTKVVEVEEKKVTGKAKGKAKAKAEKEGKEAEESEEKPKAKDGKKEAPAKDEKAKDTKKDDKSKEKAEKPAKDAPKDKKKK